LEFFERIQLLTAHFSTRFNLKTSHFAIALSLSFFVFNAAFSQTPSSDTTLITNPGFVSNCAKCHGKNAEGRHFRGPALISEKVAAASEDELHNIITNGKGHMPKYKGKLSPDEIDTIVRQIKALNKK
jgi:mono/diheme cytochrome c family protein